MERHRGERRRRTAASALLRRIRDGMTGNETTLGDLLVHLGPRAPGFLLLALTIPAVVPTPGFPSGLVFGAALVLVALQMMAGREQVHAPGWLTRRRVPPAFTMAVLDRAAPLLERIERRTAPRWRRLTRRAMERPLGLVVLVMGLLITLPIPFGNLLPGLAVLVLALGLVVRDGAAVVAGIGLSLVAVVGTAGLAAVSVRMVGVAMAG
ncbi:exopolysaccharide biosynthesis protein [Azospirillum halopraeferens]|uniref:exopolysaccharide biosynthesis protein n=1 Tax=Azospirillum halopraeferens TaxID=34010 RepID=UPI000490BE64|nr:exopolysaccharide biosynthesis protein [Azospirillum halopraeferens]